MAYPPISSGVVASPITNAENSTSPALRAVPRTFSATLRPPP